MARRDSKGRFLPRGGSSRGGSRRRGRKGMGSIITVRRGGMGALDTASLLPPLVGGGLAALTALAIRWFVDPTTGSTQGMLVKWAPLFGNAVGAVGAMALYFMGGSSAAVQAFLAATAVGAFGVGSDMVMKEKGGAIMATFAPTISGYGFGAIVPEYASPGMGAIAMESVGPNGRRAGAIGSYGETVSLSGVNTGAFGTPGFQA